jgi:hypothetical protein
MELVVQLGFRHRVCFLFSFSAPKEIGKHEQSEGISKQLSILLHFLLKVLVTFQSSLFNERILLLVTKGTQAIPTIKELEETLKLRWIGFLTQLTRCFV